jgi:hypothetical protein
MEMMSVSTQPKELNIAERLGKVDWSLLKNGALKIQRVDMQIQLWYTEDLQRWRWTLTSGEDSSMMESGSSPEIREAMDDVATTVEWLLSQE